ncbi:hypothetical protein PWT90_03506 [Aphanocladium album]|nr:hypothetical protein PWT90_03506 [Aphanocladium album]
MAQSAGKSIKVRLCIFSLVVLDLILATLNCFIARSAISIAGHDFLHDHDDYEIWAIQTQHFTSLGVPEATIATAVVCSVHAITGVLSICYRGKNSLTITFISLQFILALLFLSVGGTIAARIAPYRMLFENYYGKSSALYYHVMYYGGIAEIVYGGLWIIVPLAVYMWV